MMSSIAFVVFNFNSIKVRLELTVVLEHLPEHLYFNSIKVRLEPFDIHDAYIAQLFQFHKGAIRTDVKVYGIPYCNNFNSIKVRLERTMHFEFTDINIISIP